MGRAPCGFKDGFKKGTWTSQEDQILIDYVRINGEGKWGKIPKKTGLKRCGKSCRLRWLNYLRPDIKRGNISDEEAELIIRLHKLLGNRWSLIAGRLPGRTDNEIKNYWNSNLRKKVNDEANNKPEQTYIIPGQESSDPPASRATVLHEPAEGLEMNKNEALFIAGDHGKDSSWNFSFDILETGEIRLSEFLGPSDLLDIEEVGNVMHSSVGEHVCQELPQVSSMDHHHQSVMLTEEMLRQWTDELMQ